MPFIQLSCAVINTDDIARIHAQKWKYRTPSHILIIFLKNGTYVEYEYHMKVDRDADYILLATALCSKEG